LQEYFNAAKEPAKESSPSDYYTDADIPAEDEEVDTIPF